MVRNGGRGTLSVWLRAGRLTLALLFALLFTGAFAQSAPLNDAASEALQKGQAAASLALVTYDAPNLDQPLWRDAVRYGEEAKRLAPGRKEPLRFLAQVYSAVGFYSRAWEAWTGYYEAGGLFDAQARAQFVDIGKDLGYAAYRAGNLGEALLYYSTVDEVEPGEGEVTVWLGRLNFERGDLAAALPYWQAAAAQNPDNRTYADFLERTQNGLIYGLEASEAFYRGTEAAQAGEQEAALIAFREAASANPQYKEALVRAAELSTTLRRPGDARDFWERVLALDPNDARARTAFERAQAQARWGTAAANAFREGVTRYNAGDAGAAAASFTRATDLNPAYADAWAWRGRVALEAGDLPSAAGFYDQARGLEPGNASYSARFDQVARTLAAQEEAEAAARREAQAERERLAQEQAAAQAQREAEAQAAAEAAAREARAAAEAQAERERVAQEQAAAEAAAQAEREAQARAEAERAAQAEAAAEEAEREREAAQAQARAEAERERLAREAEAAAPTAEPTPSETAQTPAPDTDDTASSDIVSSDTAPPIAEAPNTPPAAPAPTGTPTDVAATPPAPTETPVETPAVTEAPSAPPERDPTQPLVLLDTTYTHRGDAEGGPKAFSLFDLSGLPENLSSPVNYAGGTLYQRIEVQRKPSDVPVTYQLCAFQAEGGAFAGFGAASQYACSSEAGLSFLYPGVYEHSQPMRSLERYGTVNWQESLSRAMLVLEDRDGNPVDNRYGFAGSWYGAPVFDLYFPMEVRYTAIVVPEGGTFTGWP